MFDQIKCVYQRDEFTAWTCFDEDGTGYAGFLDNHEKRITTWTVNLGPQVISKQSWG